MSKRRYLVYDVFTDRPLTGNPLAIVLDGEGLDIKAMQAIAGEFNLSETVFVLPPGDARHRADIRIFTPRRELPFAGHPTVGTAIALSDLARLGQTDKEETEILVLQEAIGPVRCVVSRGAGPSFAEFDLPRLPERLEEAPAGPELGAALGLDPQEIGFENHRIGLWSAGVPYCTVPVANLDAAARARLNARLWDEMAPRVDGMAADAWVYCRETVNYDCAFHARMFAPSAGVAEDPATGSAAAAFAGAVVEFDAPVDGSHALWIEQGLEMGRPSRIRLEFDVDGGTTVSARIGGHALRVAEGTLYA